MNKIFFYTLRDYDELPYAEKFRDETGIDFDWSADYPSLENADLAKGCDAISCTPCTMDRALLQRFADLGVRFILCRSIGYDHVDLEAARELGMRVSNVGYPPDSVADYAIMLMMMCLRNIQEILKRAEVQDYSLKNKIGRDISGVTVGVIGTGKIGTTVIRHLSGFGCPILAYDPYENDEAKKYAEYVPLDELLRQADVITLHANATEENHHLLDSRAFAMMKQDAVIVNTSRGKLIDTDALIDAIESGKLAGAALDVLEKEDGLYYYNKTAQVIANRQMAILRSFPNVIMCPHTAFYTRVDVLNMVKGNFEAFQAFEIGGSTPHEVTNRE